MYKDYELISEQKMIELKKAYENKFSEIKILSSDNTNFTKIFNECLNMLNLSKHYILNLINYSKNLENLNILKQVNSNIENSLENLTNVYEVNKLNDELDNNENLNYINNLKKSVDCIILFLENIFILSNIETNIKIKSVLNNIISLNFNNLKNLNNLYLNINNYKVLSIFKNKNY